MKHVIFFLLLSSVSLLAADATFNDSDLSVASLVTPEGVVKSPGCIQDVIANYPSKAAVIKSDLSEKIWAEVDKTPTIAKSWSVIAEKQGVTLSQELKTAIEAAQP